MLQAQNINKQVHLENHTLDILKGISFSIDAGDSLAITGASGSGKSTLLGILAGLDQPSTGSVHLAGENLQQLNEDERAKLRAHTVGFVFQSFQLLPGLTALENVLLPLELHGLEQAEKKANYFLERVGLAERLNHYPKQLSGGEQQRVALARAFANKPTLLFADEPTGNLDSRTGAEIIELLFELNREENTTLVLVTHEQRLADRCAKRLNIEAGEVSAFSEGSMVEERQ